MEKTGHTQKESEDDCMSKKDEKPDLHNMSKEERMKYEIAEELGLLDRVLADGWRSLSSKETGRIGGMMARRKKVLTAVSDKI